MQVRHALFRATLINATGTAESGVVDTSQMERTVGVAVKASSVAGAADVKLELRYSSDGVTFGAYADETDVIASTNTGFGATPEGLHVVDFELKDVRYVQFLLTGVGANPADTLVDITLTGQEIV